VTFSDIAMNDNSEDYLLTQGLLETVLETEKPDLVVLVGDIVDPAHSDEYRFHWNSAMEYIVHMSLPYVWTGGSKNGIPDATEF